MSIYVTFSKEDIDRWENGPIRMLGSDLAIRLLISHRNSLHPFWDFRIRRKLNRIINFLLESYL